MRKSEAMKMRNIIEKSVTSLNDTDALEAPTLFPMWAEGKSYSADERVCYNGTLYRCITAHTSQADWTPDKAVSLWVVVVADHAGTFEDPIPYNGNMALVSGLYYIQEYHIYKCTRDTVNPVYNPLGELVGIYVEVVV